MARKQRKGGDQRKRRSAAQREWTAAVGVASAGWKGLNVLELRAWNVQGKVRRMSGQRYYVMCNAGRIRDGEAPLRLPPTDVPYDENGVLKRVLITYPGGRIRIQVELRGVPTARITVWASQPLDRWVSRCYKFPRLGPLPAPVGRVNDITDLYVKKYGRPAAGKRFRIFLRQRQGKTAVLSGSADVTVPEPEAGGGQAEKG